MICSNLLRYNYDQKWIILDTETTGLNLIYTLPFQVSFVKFTIAKKIEEHNYFVDWPHLKMSKGAAAVTRFNFDYYKSKAKPAKEILDIVESSLHDEGYKITGQNFLGYDSMIIDSWRRALGMKSNYSYLHSPFKVYDTIALSKAIKLGIKPDISSPSNFLSWQYKMINYVQKGLKTNLGLTAKELQIQVDENKLHDALYDININREIFLKQILALEI
jgi:DNA polymerase III alpha subunit (gram-positive type)